MEYKSKDFHQTHTQVIINLDNMWYIAPDNSSDINFGEKAFASAPLCISCFIGSFVDYLKYRLKNMYNEDNMRCKEFSCIIEDKVSDDEYLNLIRNV